jgi:EAL domain-containing protein (putative c-di-GMP-specific phosphodiesterase class I)
LQVVVEGLEDQTSWHTLQAQDCDIAQSCYVALPMPVTQFAGWSATWRGE